MTMLAYFRLAAAAIRRVRQYVADFKSGLAAMVLTWINSPDEVDPC